MDLCGRLCMEITQLNIKARKKKRVLPTRYKNYTFLVLPVKNTAGNHDENGGWIPGLCLLEEDALSWRFWVIKHCTWSRQFYALQLCALHHHLFYWRQISEYLKVLKWERRSKGQWAAPSVPVLMLILGNWSIRRKGVLELAIKQYWGPWKNQWGELDKTTFSLIIKVVWRAAWLHIETCLKISYFLWKLFIKIKFW